MLLRMLITKENDGLFCEAEAGSGEEALAYFDDGEATVVILDQMMPGMTGLETAKALLARHPDLRIILFSAYLDERLLAEARQIGIRECLDKRDFSKVCSTVRLVAAA
jgi:DNA-binding NarL/FixJ family response regulator